MRGKSIQVVGMEHADAYSRGGGEGGGGEEATVPAAVEAVVGTAVVEAARREGRCGVGGGETLAPRSCRQRCAASWKHWRSRPWQRATDMRPAPSLKKRSMLSYAVPVTHTYKKQTRDEPRKQEHEGKQGHPS